MMAEAEKKLNPGWWEKMTSGGVRYDEAGELFMKAGNMYKKDKEHDEAINAFVQAAKAYAMGKDAHDAANAYVQAASCAKQAANVTVAVDYLQKAVDIYSDDGNFSLAGRYQKEIAEIFEGEKDTENALKAYKLAAETFDNANNESATSRSCRLKVAVYAAELQDYTAAIEIFEKVAEESLEGLGKWSVKEHLLKAGLCKLAAGDLVSMHQSLDRYKGLLYTFSRDRECTFLEALLAACENFDVEAFTRAVVEHDTITPLDPWKTMILTRIKKGLQGGGDLGGDELDGDGDDGAIDLK